MDSSKLPYRHRIEKPWGHEIIWAHVPQKYVGKILYINAGKRLSLQYHNHKHETMYVISGPILVTISHITKMYYQGDIIDIPPETIHRITAPISNDCVILEVSTDDLEDIVRLSDDFNRS